MNKKVKITISGTAGSGKSRIAYLIKEALKNKGLNIEHSFGIDFDDENQFDNTMSRNIDSVVENISKNRTIIIEEIAINKMDNKVNVSINSKEEFNKGKVYTREFPNGDKCIFEFKSKHSPYGDDMIVIERACSTFQPEYLEDTSITISKEGTGEGTIIRDATQEEIDYLDNYDENSFD